MLTNSCKMAGKATVAIVVWAGRIQKTKDQREIAHKLSVNRPNSDSSTAFRAALPHQLRAQREEVTETPKSHRTASINQ